MRQPPSPDISAGDYANSRNHFSILRETCRRPLDLGLAAVVLALLTLNCRPARPKLFESQFARIGAAHVATKAPGCQEVTDFVFSPNGQRVVYTGPLADDRNPPVGVWVNESLVARVDSVFEIGFSETGEPFFVGQDGTKSFLYYRYARPRAYDQIHDPGFSRDGDVVAYLTVNGANRSLVVSDGTSQVVTGVLDYALSPSGQRFAYATLDANDWVVIEGPETSDVYDWVQDLIYSRDGSTLGFTALVDDTWLLVLNGEVLESFGPEVVEVSNLTLANNGSHLAYVVTQLDTAEDETYDYAVLDNTAGEVYLGISSLCLSPDGRSLAYVADDGDGQFVVNQDSEGAPYDEVWALTYSRDASSLAYVAGLEGEEFVVVDHSEHPGHEAIDHVRFSRDGTRVGYGALDGLEFNWVVEDAH